MFYDLHTMKTKSFQFYDVSSSDLSGVWCLKENENVKRAMMRAMMRAMGSQKVIDKKTEERLNPLPTY